MSTATATDTEASATNARFGTALISTAGHCAVACGFCFRADRAHGFLDLATYTKALSRLKELGVEGVCLTGGEPSHHPELRQLVRLAHQFGLPVSVVTSARTPSEIDRLAQVGHLLSSITISADSAGAMRTGGTSRSVGSAGSVLESLSTPSKVLHLTYWQVTHEECRELRELIAKVGAELQVSPVLLDEKARNRADLSLKGYLRRQLADTETIAHHVRLSQRFREHVILLQALQLCPERQHPCQSAALYVSANGHLRRCPYGKASIAVQAPRTAIRRFLTHDLRDRTTPDCAAICRPEH